MVSKGRPRAALTDEERTKRRGTLGRAGPRSTFAAVVDRVGLDGPRQDIQNSSRRKKARPDDWPRPSSSYSDQRERLLLRFDEVFDEVFDELLEDEFDELFELVLLEEFDELFELVLDELFELVFEELFELWATSRRSTFSIAIFGWAATSASVGAGAAWAAPASARVASEVMVTDFIMVILS